MNASVLILPGIGNSGCEHWQSLWEASNASFRRVVQRDWDRPARSDWVESLEKAVSAAGSQTVLVAHSLACLVVAHWAAQYRQRIQGALLVAVPDPQGPNFPKEATGFSPVPKQPLPFKSIVVASSDDPYGTIEHSSECASAWRSRLVTVGAAGHINASSGLGRWSEGFELISGQ